MELRRGDIVTIAPPGDFSKPRAALVLQVYLPDGMQTVTVVPLTSDLLRQPSVRVLIAPTPGNGLTKLSEVMADNVQTLLLRRIGGVVEERTSRRCG